MVKEVGCWLLATSSELRAMSYLVSSIQYPVSSIQYQVSRIQHHLPDLGKSKNQNSFFACGKSIQCLQSTRIAKIPHVGILSILASVNWFAKSVIPGL